MYDPVERFKKWLEANIKDPIPMDDKSRLHEFLDVISSPDTEIPYKEFALKGLSMMAIKYSAHPIITCGALPLISHQLLSPHPPIIAQCIRTLTFIANHGGKKDIRQEKLHMVIRNLVSEKRTPQYIKDMGLKFYFEILDTPLSTSFSD
jgi:hypothetical protein